MADFFSARKTDIVRALKYWEKQGILSLSYTAGESVPTGIAFSAACPEGRKRNPSNTGILDFRPDCGCTGWFLLYPLKSRRRNRPRLHHHSRPFLPHLPLLRQMIFPVPVFPDSQQKKNTLPAAAEELQHVLYVAQTYFGHLLSPTEIECIMFFYDDLHFSADLLEYLVEYCVSNGSTSIHYLKKVGLAWQESGIRDVASAKQETTTFNKHYYTILKAFGIRNRAPVEKEAEMMDRWLNTYGFTIDLITEACQRTVSKIGQPSFQYAEGILSKWKEQGVRSHGRRRTARCGAPEKEENRI